MPLTIADFLPVKQLDSHQYSIVLEKEWRIGVVPNGGYVTSAMQIVARTHMQLTHASRNQPNVVNLHLEFTRPTSIGSAVVRVKDVKIGARLSNLHVTLAQKASEDSEKYVDKLEGYITMTDMSSEKGLTLNTGYSLSPVPLPVSLSALSEGQDSNYYRLPSDPFAWFRPATQNMQMHLVKPAKRPEQFPKAMLDEWIRLTPVSRPGEIARWTNDALGFAVDMFPQMIETLLVTGVTEMIFAGEALRKQLEETADSATPLAKFWYPTLNLNLDVKKALPEDGVEWLFSRLQARRIKEGRFDLLVEIWDDTDELVAISTHACLAVDSSRNLKSVKKSKL